MNSEVLREGMRQRLMIVVEARLMGDRRPSRRIVGNDVVALPVTEGIRCHASEDSQLQRLRIPRGLAGSSRPSGIRHEFTHPSFQRPENGRDVGGTDEYTIVRS
jgi:hypothetical protein